jgi:hypothetical protein
VLDGNSISDYTFDPIPCHSQHLHFYDLKVSLRGGEVVQINEIKFGEVIFSKTMMLDEDAPLTTFPDQFDRLQSNVYPYTVTFVVNTSLFYREPLSVSIMSAN